MVTDIRDNKLANIDHAVVLGMGKTGLSCARFLARRGCRVVVMDSRAQPPGLAELRRDLPRVESVTGGFDDGLISQAGLVVVSPGVALDEPAVAAALSRGQQVVGDIELFARYAQAPVIAITGSNGKSTVTTLVAEMARRAGKAVGVGGNIGTPALTLIEAGVPDLYVLELSSFQLETATSLNPAAAVVLNVSQDHLDRYDDMEHYAATKARIYDGDGVMVINLDDPRVAAMARPGRKQIGFTLGRPANDDQFGLIERDGQRWLGCGEEALLPLVSMRLAGHHNVANALAALALGRAVGLPMDAMVAVLPEFGGLPHRCQWLAEIDGVNWFNDSKATNVGAAVAAIEGMAGKVVLIAGGQAKGQEFAPLKEAVAGHCRAVVLMGADAPLIEAVLDGCVATQIVASMSEAVARARELARPGDSVLLSPACASFDMFKGFEDRGEQFAAAVGRVA